MVEALAFRQCSLSLEYHSSTLYIASSMVGIVGFALRVCFRSPILGGRLEKAVRWSFLVWKLTSMRPRKWIFPMVSIFTVLDSRNCLIDNLGTIIVGQMMSDGFEPSLNDSLTLASTLHFTAASSINMGLSVRNIHNFVGSSAKCSFARRYGSIKFALLGHM